MNIINPSVDQTKIKGLAKRAMAVLSGEDGLETVYALCLALASASSAAGVEHIDDVTDQVRGMHRSIEAAKPSTAVPRFKVVSPADFRRLTERFGIKLD